MYPDTPDNSTIWKPIPGYEKYYRVSDSGLIWSDHKHRILATTVGSHGYLAINLYPGNSGRLVHRLVAQAFVPNPLANEYVNHKDGDKLNNHYPNLEWVTAQENTAHGIARPASYRFAARITPWRG